MMEERDRNFIITKISTLEESLKHFDKSCLLEQLDVNLELVRRNKETKEQHLRLLKEVDKDLLKLSQIHHPDKAIGRKKSDGEVENAQNMQIAINATRTVLKALTEEFLKDIDVHYKYEFFAKLDINTLINEKQIDLEINNVLCKVSRLSEIKRVNIVGEIRNFLLKCRNCLESFHRDNKYDFVRYRNHALHHLHKCIEGYEILFKEFELIVEECSTEEDENTTRVMQNMYEQSLRESKILQDLQGVAKRSLEGTFEIFPIYEPKYNNPKEYVPMVPKELEYFVLPFMYYVDVLLMCSVMVAEKSRGKEVVTKLKNFLGYNTRNDSKEFIFFKEPALSKAYHLASNYYNKDHYKEKVLAYLKEKNPYITQCIIRETFQETVKEIEQFLSEEFDINTYKEGKSNREQFNERLFKLKDSMAEFKVEENNLLEKFKLYEKETEETRKKYDELSEKTEQNIKVKNSLPGCLSSFGTANQTTQIFFDQYQEISRSCDRNLKGGAEKITCFNSTEREEVQQNIKAKYLFPDYFSSDRTAKQTSQMDFNQYQDILQGCDKISKVEAQEIPAFNSAEREKVQQNMKAKESYHGTLNQTSQMIFDQYQDILQGRSKNSKDAAEGMSRFK